MLGAANLILGKFAGLREPSGEQILALFEKYDVVVPKEVYNFAPS